MMIVLLSAHPSSGEKQRMVQNEEDEFDLPFRASWKLYYLIYKKINH